MSDLSEGGKVLVQAGRQADRPSDADRERVLAALRTRLGDAAVLGTVLAPSATGVAAMARPKFAKWGWVGSTVLVAGAIWLAPRVGQRDAPAVAAPSASVANVENVASAEIVGTAPEAAPSSSAVIAGTASSRPVEGQKPAPR